MSVQNAMSLEERYMRAIVDGVKAGLASAYVCGVSVTRAEMVAAVCVGVSEQVGALLADHARIAAENEVLREIIRET